MNCLLLATDRTEDCPSGQPSLCLLPKRAPWGNPIRPRLEVEPGRIVVNAFSVPPASQPEDAELHFRSGHPVRLLPASPRPVHWTGTRYTTPSTARTGSAV